MADPTEAASLAQQMKPAPTTISAPVPPCWHCGYEQKPLRIKITGAALAALAEQAAVSG